MKINISNLGICLLLLLSSCGSVDYIEIQTYNPSNVTFPKEVHKVLIVNNALTQAADEGYTYRQFENKPESKSVQKDSAMVEAVRSLGYNMADASYYEDVLLYNKPLQHTELGITSGRLSPMKVKELCQTTGADAIISWDQLQFIVTREMDAYVEGFIEESINIKINGMVCAYLPDRETPLAVIPVKDSLYINEVADDPVQMKRIMPTTEMALSLAAEYIGVKQVDNFVPHWQNESRWVYNEGTSRWKEASAYMNEGKWEKAAERWKRLYDQSTGWGKKAKAASNLALYYEMKTDLPSAYEWAEKSFQLLKPHQEENNKTFEMQELYLKVLGQRKELNKKLNTQIGVE